MERKAFLDQEPPPGYIPGIGRGATGFVTQADLGSSNLLPLSTYQSIVDDVNNNANGRFADARKSPLEKNEQDDDQVFDEIEKRLAAKRGRKRNKLKAKTEEDEKNDQGIKADNDTVGESIIQISEQFRDAKKELSKVSEEQWASLPESGDFTRRNKRLRAEIQEQQRSYRNSDMIALGLKEAGATDLTLMEANEEIDADETEKGDGSVKTDKVNLFEISRVKDRLLETQLKLGNHTVSNSLDRDAYLLQLQPTKTSQYNIGDYKKTRKLLAKLRETSPNNPQNWIASAKLEFDAKKTKKARELIQEGCDICPKSEEIWLNNLEMNCDNIPACKVIVADAIRFNHKSRKLWLKAAKLEQDNLSKVRILRKALELLPKEVEIWLAIVDYEDSKEIATKILEKAITIIPESEELLLKLASFQDKGSAVQTLIDGMANLSEADHSLIWIKIAKLEEEYSENELKIGKYVTNGMLASNMTNDQWLIEAERCESDNHPLTCRAIVLECLSKSFESIPKHLKDVEAYYKKGNYLISDAILTYITDTYPQNLEAWRVYLKLKRELKDYSGLFFVYEMAISANLGVVDLYIEYAEDKIRHDLDVERIRSILADAHKNNTENEKLWIFTVDFELKHGSSLQRALDVFDLCMKTLARPSLDIWLKKIRTEIRAKMYDEALKSASQAIIEFLDEACVYVEMGQILHLQQKYDDEQKIYELGIKKCAKNEKLYINLSNLHFKVRRNIIKARSVLEEGISRNLKSESLHHSRIMLELDSNNREHATRLVSKALTLMPSSPLLWNVNIQLATKQQVKNIYALALKKTNDHPMIILTIAQDLWKLGKMDRAQQFFKACLDKDANYGDAYVHYYAFLLKFGSREEIAALEKMFVERIHLHGELWERTEATNWLSHSSSLTTLREAAVGVTKIM